MHHAGNESASNNTALRFFLAPYTPQKSINATMTICGAARPLVMIPWDAFRETCYPMSWRNHRQLHAT
jgi:hypothetical protein